MNIQLLLFFLIIPISLFGTGRDSTFQSNTIGFSAGLILLSSKFTHTEQNPVIYSKGPKATLGLKFQVSLRHHLTKKLYFDFGLAQERFGYSENIDTSGIKEQVRVVRVLYHQSYFGGSIAFGLILIRKGSFSFSSSVGTSILKEYKHKNVSHYNTGDKETDNIRAYYFLPSVLFPHTLSFECTYEMSDRWNFSLQVNERMMILGRSYKFPNVISQFSSLGQIKFCF